MGFGGAPPGAVPVPRAPGPPPKAKAKAKAAYAVVPPFAPGAFMGMGMPGGGGWPGLGGFPMAPAAPGWPGTGWPVPPPPVPMMGSAGSAGDAAWIGPWLHVPMVQYAVLPSLEGGALIEVALTDPNAPGMRVAR